MGGCAWFQGDAGRARLTVDAMQIEDGAGSGRSPCYVQQATAMERRGRLVEYYIKMILSHVKILYFLV